MAPARARLLARRPIRPPSANRAARDSAGRDIADDGAREHDADRSEQTLSRRSTIRVAASGRMRIRARRAMYTAAPTIMGTRRPKRSPRGPASSWPIPNPSRQAVRDSCMACGDTPNSAAIAGRAGRYASRLNGAVAASRPSASVSGGGGSAGVPSPSMAASSSPRLGSVGVAAMSSFVYCCCGDAKIPSESPASTTSPWRITIASSVMWRMTLRSCEMSTSARPCVARNLISRLRICACAEMSSADVGSSATMSFGSLASARAMPTRWHWPPLKSGPACGPSPAAAAPLRREGLRQQLAAAFWTADATS